MPEEQNESITPVIQLPGDAPGGRRRGPWDRWLRQEPTCSETHRVITPDGLALHMMRIKPQGAVSARHSVILLHGLASNRFTFNFPDRSLGQYLASQGFDVFVPELRGGGLSEKHGWNWDLDHHLTLDLPAVIDRVQSLSGRERVHWVGHSMGGILLMCYGIMHSTEQIQSGVTIASALDYRVGRTGFRKLLALKPVLNRLTKLPYGRLVHLLSPLMGRVKTPVEGFNVCVDNMEPRALRRLHANVFETIPTSLLDSLSTTFEDGGLRNRDSTLYYLEEAGAFEAPLLMIAGSVDRQVSLEAVHATRELVTGSPHSEVSVFGHPDKSSTGYGHFDLIVGQNAVGEVWPQISEWLLNFDET